MIHLKVSIEVDFLKLVAVCNIIEKKLGLHPLF
jgi:hypothetical protein